jgi:predicted nucleotidyltransferase
MLSKDFSEFIALLNKQAVEYLVIGGYAVAFHGHPRYTKDIDLWIGNSHANALRLLAAIDEFGMGSLGLTASDLQADGQVIQLGYPPNRIDLIVGIEGLDFREAFSRRETVDIHGVTVCFAAKVDLIAAKQAAGRHQDLADIENLEAE